jgi:hypothetical protein
MGQKDNLSVEELKELVQLEDKRVPCVEPMRALLVVFLGLFAWIVVGFAISGVIQLIRAVK